VVLVVSGQRRKRARYAIGRLRQPGQARRAALVGFRALGEGEVGGAVLEQQGGEPTASGDRVGDRHD
jgi:hypothetical protein